MGGRGQERSQSSKAGLVSDVVIRSAREADHATLGHIWRQGQADPDTGVIAVEPSAQALTARIAYEIAENGWEVFACEAQGRVTGLLALSPREVSLREIYVDEAHRSQGIGKALLDFAKSRMRQGFWLRTHIRNVKAHRFYEREGLRFERVEPHPQHPDALFRIYEWTSPPDARLARVDLPMPGR